MVLQVWKTIPIPSTGDPPMQLEIYQLQYMVPITAPLMSCRDLWNKAAHNHAVWGATTEAIKKFEKEKQKLTKDQKDAIARIMGKEYYGGNHKPQSFKTFCDIKSRTWAQYKEADEIARSNIEMVLAAQWAGNDDLWDTDDEMDLYYKLYPDA